MRRTGLLIAVLLVAGCGAHVPAPVPQPLKDWTITATWNYNFTNYVPCSATVTKGCISSFTWGYLQGTTPIPLKTSAVSVCAGTTQPESCTDTTNATVGIGSIVPYIIASGVDNNGNSVSSSSDQGTAVNVAIGTPSGIGIGLQ